MLNQPGLFEEVSFPDTAFAIYEAFDAGEYQHDGPSEDPVEAFTIPMLREILDGQR